VKRWRIGLLGIVVSILVIVFIVREIDPARFWEVLLRADYGYVLPSTVLLLVGLITRAIRWQVLLNKVLPLRRSFSMMNVAYLVNGVLPLRIGELARIYLATRATPPVPALKTASTIVVERMLDLLAVVVMVIIVLAVGPVPPELQRAALLTLPMIFIGFLTLILMARWRTGTERLAHSIVRRLPILARSEATLLAWLGHVLDSMEYLTHVKTLLQALIWTVVSWGFSVAAGYILMLTFYPVASLPATLAYIAAAAFAIAVPAIPGNVGPYEAAIVVALNTLNMGNQPEVTLAFAILVHGLNLFVHAATGVVGFVQEGISLGQLSRGVQTLRQSQVESTG
jgi:glycosyltransferase 2 family protein